ncbi:FimV/HubP family polar landmark protein [Pollutimonas nitritireducens]|nr:FimV/HubP family polar landmark protein [Pollutimonas nitritireducens]
MQKPRFLVGVLATALLMCTTAHAAGFGHSRILSTLGQPLRIDVPVKQLSAEDLRTLQVSPAPAAAWAQAGLTPPVDLGTLKTRIADGLTPGSKVIQVSSSQAFDKPVADLLLDIRTASGQQRYQVSLLTHSSTSAKAGGVSRSIRVQQGDTMFDIAQRHAVPGVTVYQMMVALQRQNPKAFIENNLNLVKAGATLTMPGRAQLTAISDREARRIFQKQAQAFALYRQRLAGQAPIVGQEGSPAKGVVSAAGALDEAQPEQGQRDQLRLSGSPGPSVGADGASGGTAAQASGQDAAGAGNETSSGQPSSDVRADDRLATQKGIKDSEARVSQLERNVKDLNQALQAQGEAATDLLVDGAKGLGITLPGMAGDAGTAGSARTGVAPGNTNATPASGTNANVAGGSSPSSSVGSSKANTLVDSASAPADGNATETGSNQARAPSGDSAGTAAAVNGVPARSQTGTGQGAASSTNIGSGQDTGVAPGQRAGSSQSADSATGEGAGSTPGVDADSKPGVDASSTPSEATSAGIGQGSSQNGGGDSAAAGTSAKDSTSRTTAATPTPSESPAAADKSNANTSGPDNSNAGKSSSLSGANEPDGVTESISSKAEQTVSWIQEHMLGVITGLLALVVLIIAWILRRANAAHDDDHPGLVTEAMVKEKLDQINLDLEHSTPGEPSAPRR